MTVEIDDVNKAIQFAEDASEEAIGLTIMEVEGRLREVTPVDTGYARNSFIATDRADDEGTPGENADSSSQGYPAAYKLGETHYINNGAVYIGKLDDGRSDQAPTGMTSVVLPEVPFIVEKAVKAAKK